MADNLEEKLQVAQAEGAASSIALPLWKRVTQTKSWREAIADIWNDNPTFRMILALCPTMGATSMAINGFTMGIAAMAITAASSVTISLIRNFIPPHVRLVAYMIVIAAYVGAVDLYFKAYLPALSAALGPYLPLIVTNCFVLGRAEAFASKNSSWLSIMDALGVGLGFMMSLTLIGIVRELLGFGSIFGIMVMSGWEPWVVMIIPAGAFLVVGVYVGIVRHFSPGGGL